ncbi:hypothetical protein PAMP_005783 [Pampus punctatissimus]
MGAMNQNKARTKEMRGIVSRIKQITLELERETTAEEVGGAVDEDTCVFLLDYCLFQLARHDFTTASSFGDMTSLMQTEPVPSSIS